jgi:N-acylneuraminate cytidylyltransferase
MGGVLEILALIPARGGSKGLPGKNLERVGGVPLVARSVLHARASAAIGRVVVSTDDVAIAEVARRAGAEIVWRPAALAGDTCTTESAVRHALDELAGTGYSPDVVALLQCTSPFRATGQLDAAIAAFRERGCDSMLSVAPFHHFIWGPRPGGGYLARNYDPARRPRRQEMSERWLETGSFYLFRRSLFDATGSRLGGHVEVFAVAEHEALEIDDADDLARARAQLARRADDLPLPVAPLQWLVLDVDGTLTDGAMYYGEDGAELKRFDTRDGLGIARWRAAGGKVAFVTGERSEAARRRANKLQIDHLALGARDKAAELAKLRLATGLGPAAFAAMGDDANDLPMVGNVGLFAAPSSAQPEVLAVADVVTRAGGGHGAARELIDQLLRGGALAQAQQPSRAA